MTITIVGLGAVGSHVIAPLRHVTDLRLVDFDLVESKNTMAQNYPPNMVRKNKAQASSRLLYNLFKVKAASYTSKVVRGNVKEILEGSILVLDCTDNFEARALLQDHCREQGIPLLHGCLSSDGSMSRIIWSDLFIPDQETGAGVTCEDTRRLPFHQMVGAVMAQTVQTFLDTGERHSWEFTASRITRV